MSRYDVFLSHATADKPDVERLARKLQEAGVEPFLDKWHLIPGERWISGLNEALAQSSALAVFIGPKSGEGAWRTREMEVALVRAAREDSFRVIPVLLPGGDERAVQELSGFLELKTLRVWDLETGEVECLFTLDALVTAVAVIPDRRVVVAGDGSGRVHFFDFVET